MAEQAKPRLVEGPICKVCKRALDIDETRGAQGASVRFTHRDGGRFDLDHKPDPAWRVLRP